MSHPAGSMGGGAFQNSSSYFRKWKVPKTNVKEHSGSSQQDSQQSQSEQQKKEEKSKRETLIKQTPGREDLLNLFKGRTNEFYKSKPL
jgi:hypothetical protein